MSKLQSTPTQGRILASILLLISTLLATGCGDPINFQAEEKHHIYPQEYFRTESDLCNYSHQNVIDVYAFEHRFADTTARGKDLWLIFGNQSTDDGFHADARNAFEQGNSVIASSRLWDPRSGDVTPYVQRKTAIALGSRFITYRFTTRDYSTDKVNGLVATEFDGVSNILYNVSYITSIPCKLHWFTRYSWERYGMWSFIKAEVWMIFHLVVGAICSLVMVIVGTVIGAVANPIDTITNLTFSPSNWKDTNLLCSLWDFVRAIFEPLIQTFWWSPGYWGENVTVGVLFVLTAASAGQKENAEEAA